MDILRFVWSVQCYRFSTVIQCILCFHFTITCVQLSKTQRQPQRTAPYIQDTTAATMDSILHPRHNDRHHRQHLARHNGDNSTRQHLTSKTQRPDTTALHTPYADKSVTSRVRKDLPTPGVRFKMKKKFSFKKILWQEYCNLVYYKARRMAGYL